MTINPNNVSQYGLFERQYEYSVLMHTPLPYEPMLEVRLPIKPFDIKSAYERTGSSRRTPNYPVFMKSLMIYRSG